MGFMDELKKLAKPYTEDEDDFAEAFDWKARMRPELDEPAPVKMTEAKPVEPRLSGWALPLQAVAADPVAQLAAEAEAFDAEMRAEADLNDEEQSIRELLREMVQEELNGELGQRFSAIPVEISRIIRTIRQPIVHPAIVQIETAQIVAIDASLIQ